MEEGIAEVLLAIEPSIRANRLLDNVHKYRAMAKRLGLDPSAIAIAVRDHWPDSNLAFVVATLIIDPAKTADQTAY